MTALPFASSTPPTSVWGCDQDVLPNSDQHRAKCFQPNVRNNGPQHCAQTEPVEPVYPKNHYEYMPAVLLNSLKRDKKPFTYTPGRLDLSEVLNEKLQKRLERKKKHFFEKAIAHQNPVNELPVFESQKQVLVMPTYNSPIDMYSMENALEALEVQAELTVAEKSLGSPQRTQTLPRNYKYEVPSDYEPKNVAQSKAFKVLQIITDTEDQSGQKSVANNVSPPHREEMTFSGLGQSKGIPSKYFQTLQKMTGTDGDDSSNVMNHKPKGFENKSNKFQVESTFTGIPQSTIPSKYFQNLKRIAEIEEHNASSNAQQENKAYENNVSHFENEMRFTGTGQSKVIPSKYFQNLQRLTGTAEDASSPVSKQQNRGVVRVSNVKYHQSFVERKNECNSIPSPPLYGNNSPERYSASIPVLQRPAAFLPEVKKEPIKKKVPRSVRFSAPEAFYNQAADLRPYEGTDF